MAVYVDSPTTYPTPWRWKTFSHMWADTPEELQVMARKLDLKPAWFQDSPPHSIAHYDVVPSKRLRALKLGAVGRELERSDFPRLRAKMAR